MFITRYSANLTASTKTANLIAGDTNEFTSVDSVINVYAVSSAIGVNISVFADNDIAIDDKEVVNIGTTLDKSAHLLDSFVVTAGTRISIFARETAAAGTTDLILGVEVLPV